MSFSYLSSCFLSSFLPSRAGRALCACAVPPRSTGGSWRAGTRSGASHAIRTHRSHELNLQHTLIQCEDRIVYMIIMWKSYTRKRLNHTQSKITESQNLRTFHKNSGAPNRNRNSLLRHGAMICHARIPALIPAFLHVLFFTGNHISLHSLFHKTRCKYELLLDEYSVTNINVHRDACKALESK